MSPLCTTCREMIPEGKNEHTCFDAYEAAQARIAELEAACEQLRRDDAEASQRAHRLEARWEKLREYVAAMERKRGSVDTRRAFLDVYSEMRQLEREAEDHLPDAGKKEAE